MPYFPLSLGSALPKPFFLPSQLSVVLVPPIAAVYIRLLRYSMRLSFQGREVLAEAQKLLNNMKLGPIETHYFTAPPTPSSATSSREAAGPGTTCAGDGFPPESADSAGRNGATRDGAGGRIRHCPAERCEIGARESSAQHGIAHVPGLASALRAGSFRRHLLRRRAACGHEHTGSYKLLRCNIHNFDLVATYGLLCMVL